jgi:predicted N-acyltransferase
LEVIPFGGADRVSEGDWNRLARRGFHLHQWFLAAERSGWVPRHLAVRADGRLLAIVPVYLVNGGATLDLHDRWLGPLAGLADWSGLRLRPTLTVGPPMAMTSECLGDLDECPDIALEAVLDRLEHLALRDRARAIVWPFVDAGASRLRRMAGAWGYLESYAGASARLRVEWPSLERYVESRGRNLRRTIRGDLRALELAGVRLTSSEDFRRDAWEMEALYRRAARARGDRMAVPPDGFFARLASRPSPAVWGQLSRQGQRLVGCSVGLLASSIVDGALAGFGTGHRGGPAYYSDLVYEPVRIACAANAAAVELGPTALFPKVLRGARLRRRFALVRGTTPAVHAALRGLGPLVAARNEGKERRALAPLGGPAEVTDDV